MSGEVRGTTDIASSALDLIGNTPLLALDRIWPGKCFYCVVKAKKNEHFFIIPKDREEF